MGRGRMKGGEPPERHSPDSFKGKQVSVEGLFERVRDFSLERRKHHEELKEAELSILADYGSFSSSDRVRFFSILYDRFADRYDSHMGEETGHFNAMAQLMEVAMPHLRFPILDITAGTGELLRYALEDVRLSCELRSSGLRRLCKESIGDVYANEVSPKMLEKAKEKLTMRHVSFINQDAFNLDIEGMRTVLCSQTFHLIAEEDKTRMVNAIHRALRKGGTAIIMEEDPFRISPTPSIEEVSMFIRAVAKPMKTDALIGRFEVNGFTKLEERAVYPIDSEHVMRLHLFRKD